MRILCLWAFFLVFLNAALPLEEAKELLDAGRYQEAYEPLKKAMAMVENPPIGWRRVLASLCMELNKTDEAIEVYKGIVPDNESKEEDFIGLFYAYAIYGDEKKALGVLTAAQTAGKLNKESNLTLFSSVLAQNGGAMRAAKIMRRAIGEGRIVKSAQNYERLFHLYRQAREYKEALNAIDSALAVEANERLYTKCAYTAFEAADYAKAIESAKRALELNATRADNLRFLIGAAAIEIKDYRMARSVFGEVLKSRRHAKRARNWLNYLDDLTRENSFNI
ncbi:MAG: hypothetical protein LBT81_06255 [Helicobacteraceae bacterium]|jgi:tetratricopeptide (TPR) repeat protein|nr:hypothetical protein [Helicobacteraceae bacterium]